MRFFPKMWRNKTDILGILFKFILLTTLLIAIIVVHLEDIKNVFYNYKENKNISQNLHKIAKYKTNAYIITDQYSRPSPFLNKNFILLIKEPGYIDSPYEIIYFDYSVKKWEKIDKTRLSELLENGKELYGITGFEDILNKIGLTAEDYYLYYPKDFKGVDYYQIKLSK